MECIADVICQLSYIILISNVISYGAKFYGNNMKDMNVSCIEHNYVKEENSDFLIIQH